MALSWTHSLCQGTTDQANMIPLQQTDLQTSKTWQSSLQGLWILCGSGFPRLSGHHQAVASCLGLLPLQYLQLCLLKQCFCFMLGALDKTTSFLLSSLLDTAEAMDQGCLLSAHMLYSFPALLTLLAMLQTVLPTNGSAWSLHQTKTWRWFKCPFWPSHPCQTSS